MPNDKKGLEEHGWQFAVASLTVAQVGMVGPGWLFKTGINTTAWRLAAI